MYSAFCACGTEPLWTGALVGMDSNGMYVDDAESLVGGPGLAGWLAGVDSKLSVYMLCYCLLPRSTV